MRKSLGWWVLLLTLVLPAQAQEPAESSVAQMLHSLGLARLFVSVQPLVQRTLAAADSAPDDLKQRVAEALAAAPLQQALYAQLEQTYEAGTYEHAQAALADPAMASAQAACAKLPELGVADELVAYQAELAVRAPRPLRSELARGMDHSARTSSIAAELYNRVERIIVEHTHAELGSQVPWSDIAAQRKLALQEAVVVWYLYCGRFAGDEELQQWLARHNDDSVQQVLDAYQQALTRVLDGVGQTLSQPVN